MSAYLVSSGPRSNAYSESRFTNWTIYDPFFAEVRAAYKRFTLRLPDHPSSPQVISIPPLAPDFIHPAKRVEVERCLQRMPPEHLIDLRAVFLLAGTRKQQRSWDSALGCYGIYWRECVFLCAHPFDLRSWNLDTLRDFYLDEVLVHEIAHHLDRFRTIDHATKENFAHGFVERRRA